MKNIEKLAEIVKLRQRMEKYTVTVLLEISTKENENTEEYDLMSNARKGIKELETYLIKKVKEEKE